MTLGANNKYHRAVASIADQSLISASNLATSIAIIWFSTKNDLAAYSLIFSSLLLFQGVLNALIFSGLNNIVSKLPLAQRTARLASLRRWLVIIVPVLASVISAVTLLAEKYGVFGPISNLWAASALALIGVLCRDALRFTNYILLQEKKAFLGTFVYFIVTILGLTVAACTQTISAATCLLVTFLAGMTSSAKIFYHRDAQYAGPSSQATQIKIEDLAPYARWALPGVIITWLYANGFLYVANHYMGLETVAELSAARLLLTPIALLTAAWISVFRPRLVFWFAKEQYRKIVSAVRISTILFVAVGTIYTIVCMIAYDLVHNIVLHEYRLIQPLIAVWGAYYTIAAVRAVGSTLMTSHSNGYKLTMYYNSIAMAVGIFGSVIASHSPHESGIVAAICLAEVITVAIIWLHGWPKLRHMK